MYNVYTVGAGRTIKNRPSTPYHGAPGYSVP